MTHPNIIWITCHDLGRFLGCYGAAGAVTPHLDALAKDGALFRNAFCTSPLCSPSRASIHTGLYPQSTGMHGLAHEPFGFQLTEPTAHFAHRLQAAGYAHRVLTGFQHLSLKPEELGYTEANFRLAPAREIGREAATVIRRLSGKGPFYLEAGFFETHLPFDWGGIEPVDEAVPVPEGFEGNSEMELAWRGLAGAVRALDSGVGEILDAVEANGIGADTWIIFTADHGLPFPRAKSTLYDAGLEAAFILRGPEGHWARGGKVMEGLTSLVDVVPTLESEMGTLDKSNCHGNPITEESCREYVFAEKTYHTGYEPMRAVRSCRHKLIVNFTPGPAFSLPSDIMGQPFVGGATLKAAAGQSPLMELYDLEADPLEKNNLAGESAFEDTLNQMLEALGTHLRDTGDPILKGPVDCPRDARARTLFS
jgi:arylsulfatase A-like enzyme